jgi:hypothetical protein
VHRAQGSYYFTAARISLALQPADELPDLYAAWDKAEPGKGYDAKAGEWKAKLDAPTR